MKLLPSTTGTEKHRLEQILDHQSATLRSLLIILLQYERNLNLLIVNKKQTKHEEFNQVTCSLLQAYRAYSYNC